MTKIIPDRKTPPAINDFGHLTIPPKASLLLPNGVTIDSVMTGTIPVNRVSVVWNYGSNRCGGSNAAAMVPQMILQGTTTKSGAQIVDDVDYLGAFMSQTCFAGHTAFEILSLNEFTPAMLDILKDILLNPVFPEGRFNALKRKAIASFEVNWTSTRFRSYDELSRLMAGLNHPYDRPTTLADLQSLELEQVREAWHTGIMSTRINIFASGDITDSLQSHIVDFAKGIRPEPVVLKPQVSVLHVPEAPGIRYIDMPDSVQSSIAIGIPTIRRDHPDYIPLRITIVALGGYFGSRLMTNIREEKGLTYGISASLAGTHEGGAINIQADCDPSYVGIVLDEINLEIDKLASTPMDSDEFDRLRSYYMTTIAATVESFKSIGEYYEHQVTIGTDCDYFERQQSELMALTPEIIRDIARRYILPDKAITVVAGPKKS